MRSMQAAGYGGCLVREHEVNPLKLLLSQWNPSDSRPFDALEIFIPTEIFSEA
jgi:hypothetical protein